ncbi:carbohydrate porin [Komagataeibacter xylinus]|nr:carbohydrate porin [Komagataeibacter xylinus]
MGKFWNGCLVKQILTSIALIFIIVICIDDAFAQSETSKSLPVELEPYAAHAFPLEGWGNAVVDPQVPTLHGAPHLLGQWFGARRWLNKHGLYLNFAVNEEFMGNVRGGRTRSDVLAGQVAGELDIDWQRLAHVSGLWTHMLVINGHGRNFGYNLGDSVTNPEQIYGGRGNVVAHLVALYAEKTFLHKRIVVSGGDIPTGSFFAYDYVACSFMNVSVCSNFAPGKYVPGGRDWPSGNLGGVLRVFPAKKVYLMGGIFMVSPHAYNGGISGWALAQSGMCKVTSQVELGWMPWFGKHSLRGNYKLGAWYDNSRYPNLYADVHGNSFQLTGQPRRYEAGMSTAWFMFDQMLVRNGPGVAEGLVAVGGAGYSQGNLVAMRDHEWIGLVESGSPWHRRQDQIGAMFQHMDMSSTLSLQQESSRALGLPYLSNQWGPVWGVQHWENVYEAFYSTHVLRNSTTMQFDFQYLQHPGATTTFHDAAVLGIQLTANL